MYLTPGIYEDDWLVVGHSAHRHHKVSPHNLTSPTEEKVRQNSTLQIIPLYATRIELRAPLGRGSHSGQRLQPF